MNRTDLVWCACVVRKGLTIHCGSWGLSCCLLSRAGGSRVRVPNFRTCCIDYPTRALSSPCFLFFRPLIDASSGVRVYGGEMTCSSSPIWAYMARKIFCSPGNTNGGAGWHNCQIRFWAAYQACHAVVFPSVRNASFVSSPGRLDLFVKSRSLSSAGWVPARSPRLELTLQEPPLWVKIPHMLLTSYFLPC